LEKAVKNRLHHVLCVFYDSPGHEILKRFDTDIDARIKILGFEISNNDWLRQMEQLQQLECIIDKGDKRVLSNDLVKLFDLLERECPVDKARILEEIIKSVGPSIEPLRMKLTDKDVLNIIKEKVFGILANRWVTEEELLRLFSTRWKIEEFIKAK